MKRTLLNTLVAFVATFLTMAFAEAKFSITEWHDFSRFLVAAASLGTLFGTALMIYLDPQNK